MNRRTADLDLFDPSKDEKKKSKKEKKTKSKMGPTTQSKARLEILASLIFSNLGGNMSIKEKDGGLELTTAGGNEWKIKIHDGRVKLKGYPNPNNYEGHIGEIEEDDLEGSLVKLAKDVVQEVQEGEDIPPPEPPVAFDGLSVPDDQQISPDMGLEPANPGAADPSMGGQPDPSMGGMPPGAMPPDPNMGMGGQPPMGGMPPDPNAGMGGMPPDPNAGMGGMPPGMPTASRRRLASHLDNLANQLELAGHKDLAQRLDLISNSIERRV
jgi:hypothetical protein